MPKSTYTCPTCGDEFTTQDELDAHAAEAHPEGAGMEDEEMEDDAVPGALEDEEK